MTKETTSQHPAIKGGYQPKPAGLVDNGYQPKAETTITPTNVKPPTGGSAIQGPPSNTPKK